MNVNIPASDKLSTNAILFRPSGGDLHPKAKNLSATAGLKITYASEKSVFPNAKDIICIFLTQNSANFK
ncbi:hypothetical protein HBA92_00305 [Ochrobactrum sp. MR28]|nr:hypothetical protein [Ochrobactrum sp. MR28]MBX8816964.1 hypothetical protein [Ochrobactrum sp. MR31]